jgi:hypothetical protein
VLEDDGLQLTAKGFRYCGEVLVLEDDGLQLTAKGFRYCGEVIYILLAYLHINIF